MERASEQTRQGKGWTEREKKIVLDVEHYFSGRIFWIICKHTRSIWFRGYFKFFSRSVWLSTNTILSKWLNQKIAMAKKCIIKRCTLWTALIQFLFYADFGWRWKTAQKISLDYYKMVIYGWKCDINANSSEWIMNILDTLCKSAYYFFVSLAHLSGTKKRETFEVRI